jgi:hypothetical protein
MTSEPAIARAAVHFDSGAFRQKLAWCVKRQIPVRYRKNRP